MSNQLYPIINELRLLTAAGLRFASTHHELSRYERLRSICGQLIALVEPLASEAAVGQLSGDLFEERISPLLTVDAVVLRQGRLLLIQRHDNHLWALPGGFVEINQTLTNSVLNELHEETGLRGRVQTLLGIFDSNHWESQEKLHLQHVVFLVDAQAGEPQPTPEALAVGFFAEDALPPLSPGHDRRVPFLFRLLRGEETIPYLDPATASLPSTPSKPQPADRA